MKVIISFLSVLLLSSCSFFGSPNTFEDRFADVEIEEAEIEFSGILKINALDLSTKATHILENKEGKEIVKLKSSTLSLSSFEDMSITLYGHFDVTDKEIFEVTHIEKNPKEEATQEVTEISWKTFYADENRFSFLYPENWNVILAGKVLFLQENSQNIVKITRLENGLNKPLSSFANTNYEEVTVNKQLALKTEKEKSIDIFFSGIDEIIKISFLKKEKNAEQNEDFFYDLLQSFKISQKIQKELSCGGENNLFCPEGFRCELGRGNIGKCIDINAEPNEYQDFGSLETQKPESPILNNINDDIFEEKKEDPLLNISVLEGDTYNNSHMSYFLVYPQHWWYRSFGAQDNAIWHTEFSEKEIENIGEGSIIVDVKHGARGIVVEETETDITILYPRDDNSHFELSAQAKLSEEVKAMAKSLQNLL